jgi:hypothetical protein
MSGTSRLRAIGALDLLVVWGRATPGLRRSPGHVAWRDRPAGTKELSLPPLKLLFAIGATTDHPGHRAGTGRRRPASTCRWRTTAPAPVTRPTCERRLRGGHDSVPCRCPIPVLPTSSGLAVAMTPRHATVVWHTRPAREHRLSLAATIPRGPAPPTSTPTSRGSPSRGVPRCHRRGRNRRAAGPPGAERPGIEQVGFERCPATAVNDVSNSDTTETAGMTRVLPCNSGVHQSGVRQALARGVA